MNYGKAEGVVGGLLSRTVRDRKSSIERHRTCLSEFWKAIPPPQRPSTVNMKQVAQKPQESTRAVSCQAIPPPQRPSTVNMKQMAQKLQGHSCTVSCRAIPPPQRPSTVNMKQGRISKVNQDIFPAYTQPIPQQVAPAPLGQCHQVF